MLLVFFMCFARAKNSSNGHPVIVSVLRGCGVAGVLLEFPVMYVLLFGAAVAGRVVQLVAVKAQVGIPMLLFLGFRQAASDCPSSLLVTGLDGVNVHSIRIMIAVSSIFVSIGLAVELEGQVIPFLHSARESSLS